MRGRDHRSERRILDRRVLAREEAVEIDQALLGVVLERGQDLDELAPAVVAEDVCLDPLEGEASLHVVTREQIGAVQPVVVAGERLPVELSGSIGASEPPRGDDDVPGVVLVGDLIPVRSREQVDVLPVIGELAGQQPLG